MGNFYSTTKILNNVYSGETLNVYDYGSTAEVLNMVYDPTANALKVNLSGYTSGVGTSGTTGVDGTSGTDGTTGAAGAAGTSGTDGTTGAAGAAGTSGTDGAAGTSGTDGVDGTLSGITSDTGFTYTTPVLSIPKLKLTTDPGETTGLQVYNTDGVLYNVYISGSTWTLVTT